MLRNRDLVPQRRGQLQGGVSPFSGGDLFGPTGGGLLSASPWQMMRRMQEDMDRLFGQFFGSENLSPFSGGTGGGALSAWAPHIDVSETDREFHIEADLPGVRQEDINIEVQNNHIVLSARMQQNEETPPNGQSGEQGSGGQEAGQQNAAAAPSPQSQRQYHQRERRFGYFERVMPLPPNVDEENIQAEFRDGVLTLRLPKLDPVGQQGRRITIQGTGGEPQSSTSTGSAAKKVSGKQSNAAATHSAGGGDSKTAQAAR